ncbi:hypothetical protein Q1695_000101 [Nippostrongylus brasiliensis]|nr:hypothetical protein Q1695_000101 [Nippostrongylus brasiliensis]
MSSVLPYKPLLAAELTTYYGVPLGTLKHPALGIRGEIYLADDHTIVLDKFTHKPQITGCTAITLGPARLDDLQRKVGDGILLPYTTPNFSWEETRRHRHRTRRRVESATFAGIDESYEEIEYVEDEEETEEREESFNRLLPTLKDGETGHREATSEQPITPELISDQSATSQQSITQEKSTTEEILTTQTTLTTQEQSRTPTTIRSFPTLVTEQSNAPKTTDVPMIVFDKADKIRLQHEMVR